MLHSADDLNGYAIQATDGLIGHVKDVYFDDESWVVRYLVVDAGSWLLSRRVLISPIAIGQPNWINQTFPVAITKEQVKNSPNIDTKKPVSRQHEIRYLGYYGYPEYWGDAGLWGAGIYPNAMMLGAGSLAYESGEHDRRERGSAERSKADRQQNNDQHLRSCQAVVGYHIHATDGEIGHVHGMLIDSETWAIRYLIIETSNWWLGHQVLIAPQWTDSISWQNSQLFVNLTQQAVKDSPKFSSIATLDREQETGIHDHYGRTAYWATEARAKALMSRF